MKSDKIIYKIFSVSPESLFELTQILTKGKHFFTSETLKETERTVDGVFYPGDPEEPIRILEWQMGSSGSSDGSPSSWTVAIIS